jgi:hypothetical protein
VVPGVHAYADQESVVAGGQIRFYVSHTEPCQLFIHRLGHTIDDPAGDPVRATFPLRSPRPQPIHPGSYVHVEKSISHTDALSEPKPTTEPQTSTPPTSQTPDPSESAPDIGQRSGLTAMTLEAWVRPWRMTQRSGIITQQDRSETKGFCLSLDTDGVLEFSLYTGKGAVTDGSILRTQPGTVSKGQWQHVVGVWDGNEQRLMLDGKVLEKREVSGVLQLGEQPLRLGAWGEDGVASCFLDGDIADVRIYGRALSQEEIRVHHQERGLVPRNEGDRAGQESILAHWRFAEEHGDFVGDSSGADRHGQLIQHGTWMIGGPSFNPEVTRFGDYDPRQDRQRGHGLRLASDDLYDCRWQISETWEVPLDESPGLYVARIGWERNGRTQWTHVPFVVRRAGTQPRSKLLVVCSTNTWHAYNGAPFGVWPDSLHAVIGTGGLPNSPGDPPAFCLYRAHAGGQGTYQMGRRMPCPAAGPYVLYGDATRYSHLMRAERFLHVWLEQSGYDYDMVTDLDVHQNPALFEGRACVVLNGHSEYWSLPALQGLEAYLADGGNLCVMSGNSLFWRVSFNEDGSVMECRKVDAPGDQLPASRRGECWHSQDGERGGLLRECGFPGWGLCGLETLGWNNQGNPKNFGPYHVAAADHFLFIQPEDTGLKNGDAFGQGPDGGLPLANGHEIDVRLSTLKRMQQEPDPEGGLVPSDPDGIVLLANGVIPWKEGGAAFDYYFRGIRPVTDQGGEMIYWERSQGGRVFNAGSIGSGWALGSDPKFQTLMRNVLHHFGVQPSA